jgi:sulfur carrier protein ThiS
MTLKRNGVVEVANLGNGKTERVAFSGDSVLLAEAVERAGMSLDEIVLVEVNGQRVEEEDWENTQLQNGEQAFLTPEIEGGK